MIFSPMPVCTNISDSFFGGEAVSLHSPPGPPAARPPRLRLPDSESDRKAAAGAVDLPAATRNAEITPEPETRLSTLKASNCLLLTRRGGGSITPLTR